jgi:hypothetical protein
MPGPLDPADDLREQHPGWTIWVSGIGRWWASRQAGLTAADLAAGCVLFLHADDPAALAAQIRAQDARRRSTPAPDTAVARHCLARRTGVRPRWP